VVSGNRKNHFLLHPFCVIRIENSAEKRRPMFKIAVTKASSAELKRKPTPGTALGFGKILTDCMFIMDYDEG
jgi:hypothetical protein